MDSARSTFPILYKPRVLLPNLASGLVFGLLNIAYAVSLAAFIFSGGISEYLPAGVGVVLIAYFVAGLIIAIKSINEFTGFLQDIQKHAYVVRLNPAWRVRNFQIDPTLRARHWGPVKPPKLIR